MTSEFAIAVHGLVFLSHKNTVVSSEVLAKNICTNPTRVRRVMSRLKKAGLVGTKEGVDGGYQLIAPADQLNLRTVADTLEVALVSAAWKSGDPEMDCMIASGMAGVLDNLFADLDKSCRDQMEKITIADLENQLIRAVTLKE